MFFNKYFLFLGNGLRICELIITGQTRFAFDRCEKF